MQLRDRDLLTVAEVAEICRVSSASVYMWLRKGKLKGTKTAARMYVVSLDELLPFMRAGRFHMPDYLAEYERAAEEAKKQDLALANVG